MGIEQYHLLHRMTLADYRIKVYYHNKRYEQESRTRLEELRYIMYHTMIPHLNIKKGQPVPMMNKLIPLPHELEDIKPKRKMSRKKIEQSIEFHKKIFAQQSQKDA